MDPTKTKLHLLGAILALIAPAAFAALAIPATALAPGPRAHEVSRDVGVFAHEQSRGALAFDLDGDRWPDLMASRHYQAFPHIYRNNEGRSFTDVADQAFPNRRDKRDRHGCAAADVDRDGRTDLYCTVGGKKGGNGPNANELWMQRRNGTFVQRATFWGVTDRYGRGRDAVFLDANGDRWPDLLVGNTFPRQDGRSGANRLFLNREGEGFRRAPKFGLDRAVGSNSLQVIDVNGDNRDDIFICGPKGIRIFKNARHRGFVDVTKRMGAGNFACESAVLGRVGGGSGPDLIRVTDDRLTVHLQRDGAFGRPVWGQRVGGGFDLAAGDANGDGRSDVYLVRTGRFNRDLRDLFLINRRGGRAFIPVRMPQTRKGIGEAVTAIDFDRDGRVEFLVQQGHRKAKGPTRLIRLR